MPAVLDRFRELRDAPSPTPDDLDALWADLAPVDVPDILGHWTGGDFATGHVVSTVLTKSRWNGTGFDAPPDGPPIACRDEADPLVATEQAPGGGGARLRDTRFQGRGPE